MIDRDKQNKIEKKRDRDFKQTLKRRESGQQRNGETLTDIRE